VTADFASSDMVLFGSENHRVRYSGVAWIQLLDFGHCRRSHVNMDQHDEYQARCRLRGVFSVVYGRRCGWGMQRSTRLPKRRSSNNCTLYSNTSPTLDRRVRSPQQFRLLVVVLSSSRLASGTVGSV